MGQRKGRQGKKRACNPTACECGQAFNCVAAIEKFFNDACRQGRAGEHTEWQGAQPGQLNLETGKGKHPDDPKAKRRGTRPHSQGGTTPPLRAILPSPRANRQRLRCESYDERVSECPTFDASGAQRRRRLWQSAPTCPAVGRPLDGKVSDDRQRQDRDAYLHAETCFPMMEAIRAATIEACTSSLVLPTLTLLSSPM